MSLRLMDRFVALHDLVDEDVAPAAGGAVDDQYLGFLAFEG